MSNSVNPIKRRNPCKSVFSGFAAAALLVSALLVTSHAVSNAQAPAQQPAPQAKPDPTVPLQQKPPADAALPATQAEQKSIDPVQQKKDQIAADSAKLYQLANELKAEMDKSTKDTLSLTVLKKAEEVEKLARKVRDEMRASLMN